MSEREHSFWARRLAAIARNTLTELTRLKSFYIVLIFALLLIGSSALMARFSFQQELQVVKDVGIGAIGIFTSLLAVLATARLLPQEIEDRTIYTILARPVGRGEYLVGKFLGVLLLLAITVLLMSVLFFAVLLLREEAMLSQARQQFSGGTAAASGNAAHAIRAAGINASVIAAIAILYVKAAVLAAVTLFISTFATTGIFTIATTTCVYFIGHLQGVAREYWLQTGGGGIVARVFLATVTLLFPNLQLFNVADDVAAGTALPLSLVVKIAAVGFGYVFIYLLVAWAAFCRKEL